MPRLVLLALCLYFATLRAGEGYYEFTPEAAAIYDDVMALRLDKAQRDINAYRALAPANLVTHHLESYLDFFRLYLSGDERLDVPLESRFERRITTLETGDPTSPWHNYALAEARLHRSLILIRFERQLVAFRELNKAHKLLRANAEDFPDFLLTYKDLGLLHAAVGSIPSQYKWGVELFSSLSGTVEEGRREMALARMAPDNPFALETEVLAAYLEMHLAGDPEQAWQRSAALPLSPRTNALHCFVRANLAMRSGRNDLALRLLEAQPRGGEIAEFPYLDFMLGLAKIRTLDAGARIYFASFNLRYRGRHFREEAHQKIAWCALLDGDTDGYRRALQAVAGGSRAGGDESAVREATTGRLPHPGLLRARLLFDGNYCQRARREMEDIDQGSLTEQEDLEYHYRTGRILEELGDLEGALSFLLTTVEMGADNPAYFACKAALQAGLIEEKRGNPEAAARHFNRCLALSPSEYRTALHLLAKAGLNRMR